MIVSINQPAYLPWLGYFHRIAASDVHIVLDHVQFEKNSFTNRNKIRMKKGWCWLTVPVMTKGKFPDIYINKMEIANETDWGKNHWATLRLNYAKAPHFSEHSTFFERTWSKRWELLNDLLLETTKYLLQDLGIKTRLLFTSEMNVEGRKDELVLNLCKAVGADVYLSGPLGKDYLQEKIFQEASIKVAYHNYIHPVYPQAYPGFEPYMSIVDLLFNCGSLSQEILMKSQEKILE